MSVPWKLLQAGSLVILAPWWVGLFESALVAQGTSLSSGSCAVA